MLVPLSTAAASSGITDSRDIFSSTTPNETQQSSTMAPPTSKKSSATAAAGTNNLSVSLALRRSRREIKRSARAEAFWQSIAAGASTGRRKAKNPPQALDAAFK